MIHRKIMRYFFISIFISIFTINAYLEALPAQVIIIRHAEKLDQGNQLSTKGKERAAAFAPYFTETDYLTTFGTPAAIYAMAAPKGDSSLRPIQTVTPLANLLKMTIKDSTERDNYRKMVDEIKSSPTYHGKTILICWEHKLIPEIARAFGALQTPGRWPPNIYDRTWVISFDSSGKPTFQNHAQRLMYGDSIN